MTLPIPYVKTRLAINGIQTWIDGNAANFQLRPFGDSCGRHAWQRQAAAELLLIVRAIDCLRNANKSACSNPWNTRWVNRAKAQVASAFELTNWNNQSSQLRQHEHRVADLLPFVLFLPKPFRSSCAFHQIVQLCSQSPSQEADDALWYLFEHSTKINIEQLWDRRLCDYIEAAEVAQPKSSVPAYDLTHGVFYSTDFGRKPAGQQGRLQAVLEGLVATKCEQQDWDLVGELLACLLMCSRKLSNSAMSAAMQLTEAVTPTGAVEYNRCGEPFGNHTPRDIYHPTLTALLGLSFVLPALQREFI